MNKIIIRNPYIGGTDIILVYLITVLENLNYANMNETNNNKNKYKNMFFLYLEKVSFCSKLVKFWRESICDLSIFRLEFISKDVTGFQINL